MPGRKKASLGRKTSNRTRKTAAETTEERQAHQTNVQARKAASRILESTKKKKTRQIVEILKQLTPV